MARQKYTRGSDGWFATRVWDGTYTAKGTKHYKMVRSDKSSRDLERKVDELRRKVEDREYATSSDITFYDYAKHWLDKWKSLKEDNTKEMYNRIITKFLLEQTQRLQDTQGIHFQSAMNKASGMKRTQQMIYLTYTQIVRSAIKEKLLPEKAEEDIISMVDKVKYSPAEKRPLTQSERITVFKADYKCDKDKIFVYLLYGTGIRRGECCALTVFDFNFKNNEVNINKSLAFKGSTSYIKDPKTSNGFRSIPIHPLILHDLKLYIDHIKAQGKTLLFPMTDGKYMTKSSYDKMWKRIRTAIQSAGGSNDGLCKLTAHIFRHNFCTALCYKIPMISIKKIAELMGDTEKVILDIYNHIRLELEDASRAIAEAL